MGGLCRRMGSDCPREEGVGLRTGSEGRVGPLLTSADPSGTRASGGTGRSDGALDLLVGHVPTLAAPGTSPGARGCHRAPGHLPAVTPVHGPTHGSAQPAGLGITTRVCPKRSQESWDQHGWTEAKRRAHTRGAKSCGLPVLISRWR